MESRLKMTSLFFYFYQRLQMSKRETGQIRYLERSIDGQRAGLDFLKK